MTTPENSIDTASKIANNRLFVTLMAAGLSLSAAACGDSSTPQPNFSYNDVATFNVDCPPGTEPMIGSSELTAPEDLPNGDSLSIACYREMNDKAGSIISRAPEKIVFRGLKHSKHDKRDPNTVQVPYDRNQFDPKKPIHVVIKKGAYSSYIKLYGNK